MSRHNIFKDLLNLFKKKKSKKVAVGRDKDGNVVSASVTETTTVGNDNIKASNTTCYVVQDDLLLIGTRAELETKLNKKVGILELESETKTKLEATAKLVNDTFKKSAEAQVQAVTKSKSSAKLGQHLEADLETEAKIDVTATAVVDLTKLMVELGVDVNANLKIEGSVTLNLSVVEIKAFMEGEVVAKASATASLSWKGAAAEAKASAEAKATLGVEISSEPFSIGDTNVKIIFKPSITAYARAEAKAAAAIGEKTGVSLGATAAIGLRGTIEAILNGNYTVKEGLDELNRSVDSSSGKSIASPDVSDKDLGTAGLEVELELSVGAGVDITPFSISKQKENGFDYAVGEGNISINIPGLATGPAGVGVGIKIYVKILYEIVTDILDALKKEIKRFIIDTVGKLLVAEFEKFKREVAILAEQIVDVTVDAIASLLDFIGKDLTAIDLKIKRLDSKLFAINAAYMKNITAFNTDPSDIVNNEALEANKAKLEKEFEAYNVYVEDAFGRQKTKINRIIPEAKKKVVVIQAKKGNKSKEEIKALKKAGKKTNDTIKRMKKLINTKNGIIIYVGPNREVLKLKPSILQHTENHLEDMKGTLAALEEFAESVS